MIGVAQLLAGGLLFASGLILAWYGGYDFLGWADAAVGLWCMWNSITPGPPRGPDGFKESYS